MFFLSPKLPQQGAYLSTPPQLPTVGGGQRQARGALTACGEEAHLSQEEGGIHMVQRLLHVLKAGGSGQGMKTNQRTHLTTEKTEPSPNPIPEARDRGGDRKLP